MKALALFALLCPSPARAQIEFRPFASAPSAQAPATPYSLAEGSPLIGDLRGSIETLPGLAGLDPLPAFQGLMGEYRREPSSERKAALRDVLSALTEETVTPMERLAAAGLSRNSELWTALSWHHSMLAMAARSNPALQNAMKSAQSEVSASPASPAPDIAAANQVQRRLKLTLAQYYRAINKDFGESLKRHLDVEWMESSADTDYHLLTLRQVADATKNSSAVLVDVPGVVQYLVAGAQRVDASTRLHYTGKVHQDARETLNSVGDAIQKLKVVNSPLLTPEAVAYAKANLPQRLSWAAEDLQPFQYQPPANQRELSPFEELEMVIAGIPSAEAKHRRAAGFNALKAAIAFVAMLASSGLHGWWAPLGMIASAVLMLLFWDRTLVHRDQSKVGSEAADTPKEWHEGIDPEIVKEVEEAAHLEVAIRRLRVAEPDADEFPTEEDNAAERVSKSK